MNIDLTGHDSLVQRPISANPRINLNPGFIITLFKSLFFWIIILILLRASYYQIVNKNNLSQFSLKAFRSEIKLQTNPGLSQTSFEQISLY